MSVFKAPDGSISHIRILFVVLSPADWLGMRSL